MKREDFIREIRNGVLNVDTLVDRLAKEGHIKLDPEPEPGKDYGKKMAERVIKLNAGRAVITLVDGVRWIDLDYDYIDQPWLVKDFRRVLAPHFQAAYEEGKKQGHEIAIDFCISRLEKLGSRPANAGPCSIDQAILKGIAN